MHTLFDDAGKFSPAASSEADSSAQIELDSGKRVKGQAANIAEVRQAGPRRAALARPATSPPASSCHWPGNFAPRTQFGFAELARRLLRQLPGDRLQAGALLALFDAPHYFRRAAKGRFKKGAGRHPGAGAGIEERRSSSGADRQLGRRAAAGSCRRRWRAALQDPVPPGQERARYKAVVEASRAAGAPLDLLQPRGRHRLGLPVPLAALSVRQLPQGGPFPLAAPQPSPRNATGRRWRPIPSTTRKPPDRRRPCRCAAWAPGRSPWAYTLPRPGWPFQPGGATWTKLAPAPVHDLHAGLQDHHAARRGGADLHPGRGPRQPGRVRPLYVTWTERRWPSPPPRRAWSALPVTVNLRHDQLDHIVTEAWLAAASFSMKNTPQRLLELREQLSFYINWQNTLKAGRKGARQAGPSTPTGLHRRLVCKRGAAAQGSRDRAHQHHAARGARRTLDLSWPRPPSSPTAAGARCWPSMACRHLPQPGQPGPGHQKVRMLERMRCHTPALASELRLGHITAAPLHLVI